MATLSEPQLRDVQRINLPEWATAKLAKKLANSIARWNESLAGLNRDSRTELLRCRLELRTILSDLLPLTRQWSDSAIAAVLERQSECLELILPRGVVDAPAERQYDRALMSRVNADPLVRFAKTYAEEARRFFSDLSGISGVNQQVISQLEGSGEPERQGWNQPITALPMFGSRQRPEPVDDDGTSGRL